MSVHDTRKMIDGMALLYEQAVEIVMKLARGHYKGEEFVHKFTKGDVILGLPAGAVIHMPTGERVKLGKRAVLIRNEHKDLWEPREYEV